MKHNSLVSILISCLKLKIYSKLFLFNMEVKYKLEFLFLEESI